MQDRGKLIDEKAVGRPMIGGRFEPDQTAARPGCGVGRATHTKARGWGTGVGVGVGGSLKTVIGAHWTGPLSPGQARPWGGEGLTSLGQGVGKELSSLGSMGHIVAKEHLDE